MILAAHGQDPTYAVAIVIVVAALRLLGWAGKKLKEGTTAEVATEEERTRRFLEALGQPGAEAHPPTPRPRPLAPLRPTVRKTVREMPVPPFAPWAQERRPPALPPQPPFTSSPKWQVPALPELPPLAVPTVPEFRTKTERVSALPGAISTQSHEPEPKRPADSEDPMAAVRALLASPSSLRTAFLLREVLGPPRGLPASSPGPTLAYS